MVESPLSPFTAVFWVIYAAKDNLHQSQSCCVIPTIVNNAISKKKIILTSSVSFLLSTKLCFYTTFLKNSELEARKIALSNLKATTEHLMNVLPSVKCTG